MTTKTKNMTTTKTKLPVPAGARRNRFRNLLRTSFFFNKLADKERNGDP